MVVCLFLGNKSRKIRMLFFRILAGTNCDIRCLIRWMENASVRLFGTVFYDKSLTQVGTEKREEVC